MNLSDFESIDLSVVHFFSPLNHGFFFLSNSYRVFQAPLNRVFGPATYNRNSSVAHEVWMKFFRSKKISMKSFAAENCFGQLPRQFGSTFRQKEFNPLVVRRYFSIAVPMGYGEKVADWLGRQVMVFGPRAAWEVGEGELLFNSGIPNATVDCILLGFPNNDDSHRLERLIENIDTCAESDDFIVRAPSLLRPGVVFSGVSWLVRNRDVCSGSLEARLIEARINLLCRLNWPHAIDYAFGELDRALESAGDFYRACHHKLREKLATFPLVSDDPIRDAPSWLGFK
jgi:hypothetical protein